MSFSYQHTRPRARSGELRAAVSRENGRRQGEEREREMIVCFALISAEREERNMCEGPRHTHSSKKGNSTLTSEERR
jgi:hypothetical protein